MKLNIFDKKYIKCFEISVHKCFNMIYKFLLFIKLYVLLLSSYRPSCPSNSYSVLLFVIHDPMPLDVLCSNSPSSLYYDPLFEQKDITKLHTTCNLTFFFFLLPQAFLGPCLL